MPNIPQPTISIGAYGFEGIDRFVEVDVVSMSTTVLNSLNLTTPSDLIDEAAEKGNSFNLSAGEFATNLSTEKEFTLYSGMGGTRVTRRATFSKKCTVDGIEFDGSGQLGVLIELKESAVVLFRNCTFNLERPSSVNTWIVMRAGAKAVFTGCMWSGGNGAGLYINNVGVAADALVVASIATATAPGGAFINTTNTAVL